MFTERKKFMWKFVLLVSATGVLAINHPLTAALVWTVGIAIAHTVEETRGKLWLYFAQVADFNFLKRVGSLWGFLLIVAPALALQCYAAWSAFGLHQARGLALLIGLRLGDAVFSHLLPVVAGNPPLHVPGERRQLNPGMGTGIIYLVDGLLLALIFNQTLTAAPRFEVVVGFFAGSLFFASVIPSLRLLGSAFGKR
jgi:hypothetical protein